MGVKSIFFKKWIKEGKKRKTRGGRRR